MVISFATPNVTTKKTKKKTVRILIIKKSGNSLCCIVDVMIMLNLSLMIKNCIQKTILMF